MFLLRSAENLPILPGRGLGVQIKVSDKSVRGFHLKAFVVTPEKIYDDDGDARVSLTLGEARVLCKVADELVQVLTHKNLQVIDGDSNFAKS